jgi:hypothetical protein
LTENYDADRTGVRFGPLGAVAVDAHGENDAIMEIGSASMGSIIILKLSPDRTPIGPSVAPKVIQAIDLARDMWGIDVPPLIPAPDLCA